MAVQHRKIGSGIERLGNLPVIIIKVGFTAALNCREAAYLNNRVHEDGEDHAACDAGVVPLGVGMKIFTIFLSLTLCTFTISFSKELNPTICRSNEGEIFFRKLSGPNIQILAVCPKKGLYFIEVLAKPKDILEFNQKILKSDLKVIDISVYKKKTKIGSQILMVEFEY
jgi:hypothetical protein